MENKIITLTINCQRGIDDLLPVFAFVGNSQGDDSRSNEISDYKSSQGWMSYIFTDTPMEQKAIYAEHLRRQIENINYITKLKEESRFGEGYQISFRLLHNPLFDDKQVFPESSSSFESAKIIFLDFSKK